MAARVTQFVSIFLLVLVVGSLWGTWFGLSRSIEALSPETFLEVGHVMIGNFGAVMPVLMPSAVLATLLSGILLLRVRPGAAYLTLAGFVCFVGVTLVTLLGNVPIDNLIRGWTPATLPADWREARDRWQAFHTVRTFLSLAGLACVLAGSLLPARRPVAPY
jgi:uncharacterized membrane protein